MEFLSLLELLSGLQQCDVKSLAVQDDFRVCGDWNILDGPRRFSAFASIYLASLCKI